MYMMTVFSEHEPTPRRRLPLAIGLVLLSVLLLGGSLVFYAGWIIGPTPDSWHYDEANNRHWHADHGHWHPGPPPLQHRDSQALPSADAAPEQPEGPALSLPGFGPPPPREPVETPEPWEYDEARDRHWHAGHGHWHRGPPPPEHLR